MNVAVSVIIRNIFPGAGYVEMELVVVSKWCSVLETHILKNIFILSGRNGNIPALQISNPR